MLTGRFGDTSGRPQIEGRLSLPRFGISADISFVIDTGADFTVLMPIDSTRLGIDYTKLTNEVDCVGIGGLTRDYVEPALIAFADSVAIYIYEINLHIATPSADIIKIPSVLGRDVINRWHITYSFPKRQIEIYNDTADHIAALPGKAEGVTAT